MVASSETAIVQLEQTLREIESLAKNDSTVALPAELQNTLKEIRLAAQGVAPDSRLYVEMNRSLETLQQTLDRLQPILKTLDEKPNALIFDVDKGPDIIPGGQHDH